jgi:hypothetical protein
VANQALSKEYQAILDCEKVPVQLFVRLVALMWGSRRGHYGLFALVASSAERASARFEVIMKRQSRPFLPSDWAVHVPLRADHVLSTKPK